ncbi:MAG: methyltransferase domain-containing protein [candidate division WOR-3 bacterium]|nr:methyltransferase domain-containing protein [candidate division WOR-3 bacterium]
MKHWTEKFFVRKPELWLHFLDRGWQRNKLTVRAIAKILRKHGIARGRLLDIACGNGRICIPMAKKGYSITGIDISSLYIADAKKRAVRSRVKIEFICGDMRKLPRLVRGKFDAVFSVWTSIGYYDKKADEGLFRTVARRMKKGALFLVFNTMSQEYLLQHYCTHMFNETDKYVVLHKDNRFDRYRSENIETWVFYEKTGNDLIYVDELKLKLRIYSLSELVEMADKAGFEFVDAYDSLKDLTPARPDSTINAVFRKR